MPTIDNSTTERKIVRRTRIGKDVNPYGYGWKFLSPAGTTENDNYGGSFEYTLPNRGQRWSDFTEHPEPLDRFDSGSDCGTGRLHIMNKFDAEYAPKTWWPWFVRYDKRDLISKSDRKVGVKKLQLLRIKPKQLPALIRRGLMRGANLYEANLRGANLYGANLYGARNREYAIGLPDEPDPATEAER